jgi:tRNA A37 threonylcarbamoyladenosine modification protein TsaB
MILSINTTDGEYIELTLSQSSLLLLYKKIKAKYKQSEKLLPEIDKMLNDKKIKKFLHKNNDYLDKKSIISGIIVVNGPGPFTATRIGVTIANALAYAWQVNIVAINGKDFNNIESMINKGVDLLKNSKTSDVIEPFYDMKPNITKSKK